MQRGMLISTLKQASGTPRRNYYQPLSAIYRMKFLTSSSPIGRKGYNDHSHAADHPTSFPGRQPGRSFPGAPGGVSVHLSFFQRGALLTLPEAPYGGCRSLLSRD